ncbi:conserved hypothetical protein [Neospora caninum Liverpool]|uniref:Uncharacterized protein n=1 Tax=Neospora caninum (strain Liverpool) TaxID=572307 RepID=F0V9G3_NEOCL|nr:conserved hypothetical protein [Neospora caninum Liverpool]CBZ50388.1 conserved hypothetical protein [Neospora caninum Liverpool]|eukprot:XP_003880422.1 conserved hypothetical protein [Neospora caninum Liverpool]
MSALAVGQKGRKGSRAESATRPRTKQETEPEASGESRPDSSVAVEYEELVAGLLPPHARFASAALDFGQDLQSHQFVEHQAQNAQGSRMLASEWGPALHALQRFALEGAGAGAASLSDQILSLSAEKAGQEAGSGGVAKGEDGNARELAERHLLSRCLRALQEDLAELEGDDTEDDREPGREGGKNRSSTARVLAQLHKGRLFQKGGRLFTSVDTDDTEIYTSSDDEPSGSADAADAVRLLSKEQTRLDASVLPLRHALRSLRRIQRRRMQAEHLLLQWREDDGNLKNLQAILSLWAKDGIYSVASGVGEEAARAAAAPAGGERRRKSFDALGVSSGDSTSQELERDVAHAAEEIRRVEEVEKGKRAPRRELQEWRAASRRLLGGDTSTASIETVLAQFLPPSRACTLSTDAYTASQALIDNDERRQMISRLEKCQRYLLQTQAGREGAEKHGKDLRKNLRQLLQPPPCFAQHGGDALRCVDCACWLLQFQHLQQMELEGTSGLLLQPVQTGFVRLLLLLSRWPRMQVPCAAPRSFRLSLAAALEELRLDKFAVMWMGASGTDEAATGEEDGPHAGMKGQTKKLYVGHLGAMYSTVWGGAFSGQSSLTQEILLWLRQLGDGDGLHMHTDADSTETEGEANHRREVALARKRQPGFRVGVATNRERSHRSEEGAAFEGSSSRRWGSGKRGTEHAGEADLEKGFAYLGGGFTHLNTSWSYMPSKRRLTYLPSPDCTAETGTSVRGENEQDDEDGKKRKDSRKPQSRDSVPEGDAQAGYRTTETLGGGSLEGGITGGDASPWVMELSSSDESVRAFVSDEASYRRRFRSWRKRQSRKAGVKASVVSRTFASATGSSAGLLTCPRDEPMDEGWQGHVLNEFLGRLGPGISLSRYTQLANAAAAGASALASASRRKRGTRPRKRPLGGSEASGFVPESLISSEQASAMRELEDLRPRPMWNGADISSGGSIGSSVFNLISEPKKLCRLRRKPRVRSVESSWDLHKPKLSLNTSEHGGGLTKGSKQTDEKKQTSAFPFGLVAKGLWGGDRGAQARGKTSLETREVQLLCVDESEVHTRLGKTKLYQQVLHGMEDKLIGRREFYVVVDEESRELRVIPAGRLVFFLTETPRQRQEQFLSRLFADLRRRSRGTFLQSLLSKRRNARNLLLMNAMIWQTQLKHVNKARLCLLLGGYWRDAAFASASAPLTEQHLLQDFLAVNGAWLSNLLENSSTASNEMHSGSVHSSSKHNSARQLIAAIRRRWLPADPNARRAREEKSLGTFQRDTPAVNSAAAHMQLPSEILVRIDEAAEDAAIIAGAAVAAADRRTRDIKVYLTARCVYALQKREEQAFTRRMRQVENTGTKGGSAASASVAGGFSADVLRSQYNAFTAEVGSRSAALKGDFETQDAGATLEDRLQEMLPPFNASAVSREELFDVGNIFPVNLVQSEEGAYNSFSASPFATLVKGGSRASQVDLVAMKESWGTFAVDFACYVAHERRVRQEQAKGGGPLLSSFSVDDFARLTKVLRCLVVLYSRQNKTFSGHAGLSNIFRVHLGRESGDTASTSSDVPPLPVIQWISRTFLQPDEQEQLILTRAKKTKLLATILWICVATSNDWKFDFESLLVHEWKGRYVSNFEACASLIGLKHTGNTSKPREYRLQLPCPLTTGESKEAARRARTLAPIQSLLGDDKKKRRRGR